MSTIDYTIKAIPTLYNGIRYRSRLEAKWAAFFDLLEWPFVYEPIDFGQWSPDFLLVNSGGFAPTYVEVKPINAFHRPTADKICDAPTGQIANAHILLVGVSPLLSLGKTPDGTWVSWEASGAEIGWGGSVTSIYGRDYPNETSMEPAYMAESGRRIDLFGGSLGSGWIFGEEQDVDPRPPWGWQVHVSKLTELWSDACNAVQWRGRDA